MSSALEYFYPRIVPGGFLVVHDDSSLHWSEAEKAVDQFFAEKSESIIPLPDNAGSVAVRKARSANPGENWLTRKRRALLRPEWTEAGNGKLADLLGNGWSNPEPWGVWGVGESHTLLIPVPSRRQTELVLELDVAAGILGFRVAQAVDVVIRDETIDTWSFTTAQNRGVRRIAVPSKLIEAGNAEGDVIEIEFRPRSVRRTCDINPASKDTRSVGVGLHRIRSGV